MYSSVIFPGVPALRPLPGFREAVPSRGPPGNSPAQYFLHCFGCYDSILDHRDSQTAKQTARPAAPIAYPAPRKDIRSLYCSHPVISFSAPSRGPAWCLDTVDAFGRLLRLVYLDGENFNAALIREGYGHAIRGFDYSMRPEFIALENQARIQGRGLWAPRQAG